MNLKKSVIAKDFIDYTSFILLVIQMWVVTAMLPDYLYHHKHKL